MCKICLQRNADVAEAQAREFRLEKEGPLVRISVIGCGRVGLVVAAGFAKLGNKVTAVDISEEIVRKVNCKVSPIYEEDLDDILHKFHFQAVSTYQSIADSEIIFICVNTPSQEDGSISLRYLTEATKEVASVLKDKGDYYVIAVKSTVTPGTTEKVVLPILESYGRKAGKDFGLCMVPEFLREGKAVYDFFHPSRIVVGEYDKRSGDGLAPLYQSFTVPIMRTSLSTAEMIKYASNAYLATRISFINEIGNICKILGVDVYEVAKGMGYDERIGNKFLNAGIGFGGSCFPKDVSALIARAREIGYEPGVLKEVLGLNERQPLRFVGLLKKHLPDLRGKTVGVLGLAFKAGTDDVRDSPAIKVVKNLLAEGARVEAYDPMGMENFKELFPKIEYAAKKEDVLAGCEAILIVTEWPEFAGLDYRGKIVIDGRRLSAAKGAKVYEGICW